VLFRSEWLDRYGPVPPAADALLAVAHLRAECVRTGVREVAVARGTARLAPLVLPTSRRIRLQRLYKEGVYKEDLEQLVLPLPRGTDPAPFLVDVLRELVPAEEPSVVSVAP